jgi:hypothetical protein
MVLGGHLYIYIYSSVLYPGKGLPSGGPVLTLLDDTAAGSQKRIYGGEGDKASRLVELGEVGERR